MTDERIENETQTGGGFDDDRLLAFALGLEDDPELLAAAEGDAELAGRLATMRADVALIDAQVGASVPEPDAAYTDLSGERWSGLKEFLEPPALAAAPRRERRWWRVAVPVTALAIIALVVGIVAVNQGGSSSSSSGSSAEVARTATDDGQPAAAQSFKAGSSTEATGDTPAQRLVEQLDRFAVVVLARARAASGALQRFAVLADLQGRSAQGGRARGRRPACGPGPAASAHARPRGDGRRAERSPEPIPSLGATTGEQGLPGKPLTGGVHLRWRTDGGARARRGHRPEQRHPAPSLIGGRLAGRRARV